MAISREDVLLRNIYVFFISFNRQPSTTDEIFFIACKTARTIKHKKTRFDDDRRSCGTFTQHLSFLEKHLKAI
jgi:hypothetical protein